MVRYSRMALRLAVAAVAAVTLALVGGAPASAAPATTTKDPSPTWLRGVTPGRYVPNLWATDGVVTQRVPVILDVQSSC